MSFALPDYLRAYGVEIKLSLKNKTKLSLFTKEKKRLSPGLGK